MGRAPLPILSKESPIGCLSIQHLVGDEGSERCQSRGILAPHGASRAPFGVVGLNHRTAPIEIRSRVAITPDATESFLQEGLELGLNECVVLSTCNRTEVYFVGGCREVVVDMLARRAGMTTEELQPYLYSKSCVCAACHIFRVISGLDSAVLGETEIVAQVKDAWRLAGEAEVSGPMLDLLFQRGMEASKRVRTETDLCRTVTSTATLAVREAKRRRGDLTDAKVVVLGAGKIAERILRELRLEGVCVVNRTLENAERLAAEHNGTSAPFSDLEAVLSTADVVFTTLGVEQAVIELGLTARLGRRLLAIDMGVPPNVGSGCENHIDVVRLDDLLSTSEANAELRNAAIPAALSIVEEELGRLASAMAERSAAPTIKALVEHGEAIRQRNLEWAKDRLGELDEKEMRIVEEMARRMMIGLLQAPIDSLKTELSDKEHREVVKRLFALDGGKSDR